MVEVRLHGDLAREFGRVWQLDITTPREASWAIEANRPGFMRKIKELADRGMVFRVRSKTHDYAEDDIDTHLGSVQRVDIIPIIVGAGPGVRFVVGAVLFTVGALIPVPGLNAALMSAGLSLMMGAVAEWLTPTPKRDEATKSKESWTMGGPSNTVDQGLPVPVIYGEVLAGGYVISAGISAAQIAPDNTLDGAVAIGGNVAPYVSNMVEDAYTVVLQFSAGIFNLNEPYTYSWAYTGFAGALAVRLKDGDKATCRIEVDFPMTTFGQTRTLTGTVNLTATGRLPGTDSTTIEVTDSVTATPTVNVMQPETSTGA